MTNMPTQVVEMTALDWAKEQAALAQERSDWTVVRETVAFIGEIQGANGTPDNFTLISEKASTSGWTL